MRTETLVVVGWQGCQRVYFNLNTDEAMERYRTSEKVATSESVPVKTVSFTDEFGAYDVWEVA